MNRKAYPSGLTDSQWAELAPLLPPSNPRGHPRTVDLREVVNGILYVLRGGVPWRMVPHDLPPWGTVWWYFRKWRGDGTWEYLEEALRPRVGEAEGRDATPSAAIIDSQSVKTTEKGGSGAMMRGKRSLVASASHIDSVTIDTVTLNPNGTVTVEGTLTCTDNGQLDVAGLTVVVTQGDNDETIVDAEGTYTCAGGGPLTIGLTSLLGTTPLSPNGLQLNYM